MGLYDSPELRRALFGHAMNDEGTPRMNGRDYIAQGRLTDKAGDVVAEAGETCERVSAQSLTWLAEQGLIRPIDHVTVRADAAQIDE